MRVSRTRRNVLQLTGGLSLVLPVLTAAVESGKTQVHYYKVGNQILATGEKTSPLVLVDTAVQSFSGDGYYLYPNWGRPVVYDVRRQHNQLVFFCPGGKEPLWQSSMENREAIFAGRIEGLVGEEQIAELVVSPSVIVEELRVPRLPVSRT